MHFFMIYSVPNIQKSAFSWFMAVSDMYKLHKNTLVFIEKKLKILKFDSLMLVNLHEISKKKLEYYSTFRLPARPAFAVKTLYG